MKSRKDKRADHSQDDRKRNDALNKSDAPDNRLPGDYPPKEDIMNRMNTQRVGLDVENFSRSIGAVNTNIGEPRVTPADDIVNAPETADNADTRPEGSMAQPVPRNINGEEDIGQDEEQEDSDVTEEDMQALGSKDLSMDMGEDEQLLKNRVWPVDMAGSDLDVPGTELDDKNEEIGSEDEENNPYSLGGDAHEDNMEGK